MKIKSYHLETTLKDVEKMGLNPRPLDCQSSALAAELHPHIYFIDSIAKKHPHC